MEQADKDKYQCVQHYYLGDSGASPMGLPGSICKSVAGAMVTRVLDTGGMRLRGVIRSFFAYPIVIFQRHFYNTHTYRSIDLHSHI